LSNFGLQIIEQMLVMLDFLMLLGMMLDNLIQYFSFALNFILQVGDLVDETIEGG
jgi:hypothetical protein